MLVLVRPQNWNPPKKQEKFGDLRSWGAFGRWLELLVMVSNLDILEPSQTKVWSFTKYIWKVSSVESSDTFFQPAYVNPNEVGKPGPGGTEATCLSLDDAHRSASPSALIKAAAFCLHVCAVISYVGASTNTTCLWNCIVLSLCVWVQGFIV